MTDGVVHHITSQTLCDHLARIVQLGAVQTIHAVVDKSNSFDTQRTLPKVFGQTQTTALRPRVGSAFAVSSHSCIKTDNHKHSQYYRTLNPYHCPISARVPHQARLFSHSARVVRKIKSSSSQVYMRQSLKTSVTYMGFTKTFPRPEYFIGNSPLNEQSGEGSQMPTPTTLLFTTIKSG